MAEIDVSTVVSCVTAVINAYHDAANLVERIKLKRPERMAVIAEGPVQDLEESLALGPLLVQAQFNHDFRHYKHAYAQGDQTARKGLKDIIINLRVTLLTGLQDALQDRTDLDCTTLHAVSENSRVNAVVCLSELYQRLATNSTTPSSRSTAPPPLAPSDARMSYASTASSAFTPLTPTSSAVGLHIDPTNPQTPTKGYKRNPPSGHNSDLYFKRRLCINGQPGDLSVIPMDPYPPAPLSDYSLEDDVHRLYISAPDALSPGTLAPTRISNEQLLGMSLETPPRPYSRRTSDGTGEYSGREEGASYSLQLRESDMGSPPSFHARSPDLRRFPPQTQPPNTPLPPPPIQTPGDNRGQRPSQPPPSPQDRRLQAQGQSRPRSQEESQALSHSTWGPQTELAEANLGAVGQSYHEKVLPSLEPSSRGPKKGFFSMRPRPRRHESPAKSTISPTSSGSGPMTPFSTGPPMTLYLPSEENKYAGFCKGAWKMQQGMDNAVVAKMRPLGIYMQVPFWRCSKCNFEGPMTGGQSAAERTYDVKVRLHAPSGIKFRWVFLAKSHVYCKSVEDLRDGTAGSFACIFCCVEQARPAPVFGNVDSFMSHLQSRHQKTPPGPAALLHRTGCIVGRLADNDEDFNINIPPPRQV